MLREHLTTIRNEYEQRKDLQQFLSPQPLTKVLELEAKFGAYNHKGFESGVPYVHFERLLKSLRETIGNEQVEVSEVAVREQIRRIGRTPPNNQSELIEWQRKEWVRNLELRDYDIRVSLNIETELEPSQIPSPFIPTLIRARTRRTFYLNNRMLQIDLTEVMMCSTSNCSEKVGHIQYEVEIEYHGGINDLPMFDDQIQLIFKLLRGTNLLYTNILKTQLNADIYRILGGKIPQVINKDILVEARNIKRDDLVFGGIVGNPGTNYMVTFKADGLRKLLILHQSGVWLVYPPYEFNLVMDLSLNLPILKQLLTQFNGTVFDGELVAPPPGMSYRFLAFDCLAVKGKASIQQSPYPQRQLVVAAISKAIRNNLLTVDVKRTAEITSPQSFFELVTQFLSDRFALDYEQDGLMFIPAQTEYNPQSHLQPMKNRLLTRIPDVVKFKESRDITIDFMLRWVDGGLELQSYNSETRQNVPFVGDGIVPLLPTMIDSTNPLTRNLPSGTVVEYEWVNSSARANSSERGNSSARGNSSERGGQLVPRRIRYDKLGANRLEVALTNWKDIHHPITSEDITGSNLSMTFAYHNRIKTSLYGLIPPGSNILDLGSGRGGDARKWSYLRQKGRGGLVVAVEPDPDHLIQLRSRIETFGITDRVRIVSTGGEDTPAISRAVQEFIPGGKVDAVTLMLSLSFFWASGVHLDALVATIVTNLKPGGLIIFLTVNGTAIQQIMEPGLGSNSAPVADKNIGGAEVHLYPPSSGFGRALDFNLPGTIVGAQREYLVILEDLSQRLSSYGIHLMELHRAEDEKLLSRPNLVYSSIYSYGFYQNEVPNLLRNAQPHPTPGPLPIHPLAKVPIGASNQLGSGASDEVILRFSAGNQSAPSPSQSIIKIPPPPPPIKTPVTKIPPIRPLQLAPLPRFHGPSKQTGPVWLDILDPGTKERSANAGLRYDDTYAPVECSWYTELVRITTIGDGSCFIHAVLKAFDTAYQQNRGVSFRTNRVRKVRRDLAIKLGESDPEYPLHTYWGTIGESGLVTNTMRQLNDDAEILDGDAMYTLSGMQRLFNSNHYLGDEVYTFVARSFGLDIFVLRGENDDIKPQLPTHRSGINLPTIVVVATGNLSPTENSCGHYETIGLMTPKGIQTIFDHDHPLIQALIGQYRDGELSFVHPAFDPDHIFIREFGLIFESEMGNSGWERLWSVLTKMRHVFNPTDPFVVTFNRLYPELLRVFRISEALIPSLNQLNQLGWELLPYYSAAQFAAIDQILNQIETQIWRHPNQSLEGILTILEADGTLSSEIGTFLRQLLDHTIP